MTKIIIIRKGRRKRRRRRRTRRRTRRRRTRIRRIDYNSRTTLT